MEIWDVLKLISGLALFLFGMELMGETLKKSAGNKLKVILGKMTSSKWRGFLLGLGVTAIIQSSSATTVMVIGFVNSGTMLLSRAVGVIMGANVGTAVTAWLTGLSGLGDSGEAISSIIQWAKPTSWTPILALIGIILYLSSKREKKRDIGMILLAFAVLMEGMELMSGSVAGLKGDPDFQSILTMFENPILGLLAGLILTVIIQSSSASIGILQSVSTTGAISFGTAVPIIMGLNIGTCVTALISCVGANKNGKRAAFIHLYFNIIGAAFWMAAFYILDAIFNFAVVDSSIGTMGIALVHTVFKILSVALLAPMSSWLEKLANLTVRDSGKKDQKENLLDERLINTPSFAVQRADEVTRLMATSACHAMKDSLKLLSSYDSKLADSIRDEETKVDEFEDSLGTYLVKVSSANLADEDSRDITKLLHLIGDFERISDHAVNIVESAEEMADKEISFSEKARAELMVMIAALNEILDMACNAFINNDLALAAKIEPLEQTIDMLRDKIKANHIRRLQKNECSIEQGFILSDILTNCERVSDHCSNVASCVIEISEYDALNMHEYIKNVKTNEEDFKKQFEEYSRKYAI